MGGQHFIRLEHLFGGFIKKTMQKNYRFEKRAWGVGTGELGLYRGVIISQLLKLTLCLGQGSQYVSMYVGNRRLALFICIFGFKT